MFQHIKNIIPTWEDKYFSFWVTWPDVEDSPCNCFNLDDIDVEVEMSSKFLHCNWKKKNPVNMFTNAKQVPHNIYFLEILDP